MAPSTLAPIAGAPAVAFTPSDRLSWLCPSIDNPSPDCRVFALVAMVYRRPMNFHQAPPTTNHTSRYHTDIMNPS